MNTPDRIPYTYLIGWKSLNKWYYGVRFAKNCHPSDLFVTYFTSSKHIKRMIDQFGHPDVKEIRKIFSDINKARTWESKVLKRINAANRSDFINKTDNISIRNIISNKGKTYEEIYGVEKAAELKLKRSLSNKSRSCKYNKSKPHGNKGRSAWNKGIPRTEDEKNKMKGKRNSRSIDAISATVEKQRGRIWYHNQSSEKKFLPNTQPEGYMLGRLKR